MTAEELSESEAELWHDATHQRFLDVSGEDELANPAVS